jgi:CheY-like chemotaxis protein/two-component sensor histidine kinase
MDTLGTLIGGIAHDFNNIMTPISGHAELLLTNATEKTPEYEDIQSILSATARAKELVRQIMTFSRNVENKIETINLPTLISEIIKLLKATIPKTIKLELNIADDCPLINGDSTQIHQLIMNLCTNAYHAIEKKKGNISITLRTANSEDTQKYPEIQSQKFVLIEIKDDGVGIPNKIIDRIFDPFFTTKPAGKGTGLGLSVVHGIIEEHNGKIKVESKPAKETKFSVYLPVTEKKAQKKLSKSKLRKPRSGNEKLLIIDDEVAITHFIKKSLSKIGYDVTISNDSYKAFNLITEGQIKFDLIILDLNMPNLTGLELAQKLHDASIKQPIILITGSDVQEEEILSNKAIYSLIRKPFLVCELEKEIGQILESTS